MTKTILVTGGAGYVGSHCCKAFANAGWNVVVYDNLSRGWKEFVKWGDLVEGDVRDAEHLTSLCMKLRPDMVAHFAALAYVGESNTHPAEYYQTNVVGTLNLVEAMRKSQTRRLVFSSTCATYGIPDVVPISEGTDQRPINPYGRTKLMVESILRDYDSSYQMKSVILRYFNAAGADPEGQVGERHHPETHAIPLLLEAAAGRGEGFTIFGSDYDTPDGTAVRDYIHVTDLADAHLKAVQYLDSGKGSDVFNLGLGLGVSVKALIDAVEQHTGSQVKNKHGLRRQGDPGSLVADALKANSVLGWTAKRSDIETIIKDAWRWYQKEEESRN